jgi:hypothetical protein
MSEKLERVQLSDDQVEKVAGGEFGFYSVRGESKYMESEFLPGKRFYLAGNGEAAQRETFKKVQRYLVSSCQGLTDAQAAEALKKLGLVYEA